MKSALVVQHSDAEHPGRLGEWLQAAGVELTICRPYAGDAVPDTVTDIQGLLVLGGPQRAYDVDGVPGADWIPATRRLMRAAVAASIPTLGVCLGGQLLAEACGGSVRLGDDGPEVGAGLIAKRDAGNTDPIFGPLPMSPDVIWSHEDEIVVLPPGAVLLAAGRRYLNQAFRVGEQAWGLQFHIEADEAMVATWVELHRDGLAGIGLDADAALARAVGVLGDVAEVWAPFVADFAALTRGT